MGRRGPKPMPSAIKKFRGTYRADRSAPNEPEPPVGAPPCPDHLTKQARRMWIQTAGGLEKLGLLTTVDAAALEGMCIAYARAVEADRHVEKEGSVITTPFGQLQTNPYETVSRNQWASVRKFAAEFGLTPASRTRVSVPDKEGKGDDAESELFGGTLQVVNGGKE